MATLTGTDIYVQQTANTGPVNRPSGNQVTGRLVYAICKYTTTNAEVTGDVIPVFVAPQGARIIVDQCRAACVALGGTSVVIDSLGTTTTATELATTDIAVTAAADSAFTPIAGLPAWSAALSANTIIYAKLGLSAAPVAARDLYFRIAYILP